HLQSLVGFKYVNLNISIDATGSLFEYLRSSGACSWEKIRAQIRWILDYCNAQNARSPEQTWKVNLNGAYQVYNMLNLEEFVAWIVDTLGWSAQVPGRPSKMRHSFEH